ncbi:FUSC family protein [Mycobacterium camsae]|uniref:FUSC family protein n=1 Tax=Mycobacterium gordonae TaxID=1778 RepID=UPI00197D3BC5|nr:FUSC family protein [Mycobacterium gordonae]
MSTSLLARASHTGLSSVRRLRSVLWPITQTSVAAGLAWYIAHRLLGEPEPIFAPLTAVVSLSATNMVRARRAGQMIVGVVLGILLGDQVVGMLGVRAITIGLAVLFSLSVAVLIGRGFFAQGVTFFNQTASAAVLVVVFAHQGSVVNERIVDVLIGGGLALVFSMLLFPVNPVTVLSNARAGVLAALRDILAQVVDAASRPDGLDADWQLPAFDQLHHQLGRLIEARSTARMVTQRSPRRWSARGVIRDADRQAAKLGLLAACVLHLARAVTPALAQWNPPALQDAIIDLAAGIALADADPRAATVHAVSARHYVVDLHAAAATTGQTVLVALVESCIDDLQQVIPAG